VDTDSSESGQHSEGTRTGFRVKADKATGSSEWCPR
jgi:hypothetical protein